MFIPYLYQYFQKKAKDKFIFFKLKTFITIYIYIYIYIYILYTYIVIILPLPPLFCSTMATRRLQIGSFVKTRSKDVLFGKIVNEVAGKRKKWLVDFCGQELEKVSTQLVLIDNKDADLPASFRSYFNSTESTERYDYLLLFKFSRLAQLFCFVSHYFVQPRLIFLRKHKR